MPVSSADTPYRSYLFAPGSDPRVMRKALASGADAVILDLEDAVSLDAKGPAREAIAILLDEIEASGREVPGPAIHVRVNRTAGGMEPLDLAVAVHPVVDGVRLPKVEEAAEVRTASTAIAALERARGMEVGRLALYPTIESARGVTNAEAIAASDPRVARLVLGHADLIADLESEGDDALAVLVPAALVALASRSAGIASPVDGATTELQDVSVLVAAIDRARALGYFGKSAIHPRQLPAIHASFTPTPDAIAAATRIVEAASRADAGAIELDGRLVDEAVVRRARTVLALRRDT